jgi:phosphoglycolate phosphatase-like HAD superfamily hydrolase
MTIECVVLDLDGTLTDLPREAPAFTAAFPAQLADLLGRDVAGLWAAAEARVRARSPELAWTMGGHAVAPADADPYILASSAAHVLLDGLGVLTRDPALRGEIITTLFRRAYHLTGAAFRPEARPVLEALLSRVPAVYVVTNAATEVATRKLHSLAPAGLPRLRIRGDARKFGIGPAARPDTRFAAVARPVHVPGLGRPVLMERGLYFDALVAIGAETGAPFSQTLVCGDIWEMDLALPAALGASVHLVRRPRTFAYELDAVRALGPRGGVSEGVAALLERLG